MQAVPVTVGDSPLGDALRDRYLLSSVSSGMGGMAKVYLARDIDEYEGRYGAEAARQAVAEAGLQGLSVFCLTVDREAPVYLPRIFGPAGYAVLRQPGRLPTVLVEVVRQLLQR
jgi:hypothetical protein